MASSGTMNIAHNIGDKYYVTCSSDRKKYYACFNHISRTGSQIYHYWN